MNEPFLIPKEIIEALIADLKDLKSITEKGIQNINKRIDEVKQRVKVLEAERVK